MSEYVYDVGISYASEDEEYVGRVIRLLKEIYNINVFFAPLEQRKMIGEDLLVYLNRVYKDECQYVAVFVSDNYLLKDYPRQEASIIKLRQLTENYRFIIPIVFGDARLDWLSKDIDYMKGDKCAESEVAYYISEKIKTNICNSKKKKEKPTEKEPVFSMNIYGSGANIVTASNINNSNIQNRPELSLVDK